VEEISKAERPYLSATLDDPSFPATIYARLVEGEDGAQPDLVAQQGRLIVALGAPPKRRGASSSASALDAFP
jgi:hypothetical protein